MFDKFFFALFILIFMFSSLIAVIFPFIDYTTYKGKLAPKTDWHNRLKYAIPVWIVSLFLLCIMVIRFVNSQSYATEYGVERLHFSILSSLWIAITLVGFGFYILRFRKSFFKRKGKIIRLLTSIIYAIFVILFIPYRFFESMVLDYHRIISNIAFFEFLISPSILISLLKKCETEKDEEK